MHYDPMEKHLELMRHAPHAMKYEVWLIKKGGWEAENTIGYFRRYAAYVAEKLGDEIRYICTINEANMGLQLAAISKRFELMARQARKDAQKAEGTVQVGMNFQKMMENIKYAAMGAAHCLWPSGWGRKPTSGRRFERAGDQKRVSSEYRFPVHA